MNQENNKLSLFYELKFVWNLFTFSYENHPLKIGAAFLRHESKFYLYALYNKNKPKSDSLMSEYGTTFFKVIFLTSFNLFNDKIRTFSIVFMFSSPNKSN